MDMWCVQDTVHFMFDTGFKLVNDSTAIFSGIFDLSMSIVPSSVIFCGNSLLLLFFTPLFLYQIKRQLSVNLFCTTCFISIYIIL
mgnify:CR=1 FL=1